MLEFCPLTDLKHPEWNHCKSVSFLEGKSVVWIKRLTGMDSYNFERKALMDMQHYEWKAYFSAALKVKSMAFWKRQSVSEVQSLVWYELPSALIFFLSEGHSALKKKKLLVWHRSTASNLIKLGYLVGHCERTWRS